MADLTQTDFLSPLAYLAPEVRQALEGLDPVVLRAVLRAAVVSSVEGDAPGFGTAAKTEGVRKHRKLVQAIAQPIKRRQASADLSAVLAALPEPDPDPDPEPEPEPEPTPTPIPISPPPPAPLPEQEPAPPSVPPDSPEQPMVEEPSPSPSRAHTRARAREQEPPEEEREGTEAGQQVPAQRWDEEEDRLFAEKQRASDAAAVLEDMLGEGVIHAGQARAAVLIAMGRSYTETAEVTGFSQRAIYKWRQKPHFQEAVARVASYLAMRLVEDIQGAQRLALDTLIEGLSAMKPTFGGELVPDWQARQRCADSLLDRGGKLLKGETLQVTQQVTHSVDEDLEAKLEELQQAQAALEREQMLVDSELAELRLIEGGLEDEEDAA